MMSATTIAQDNVKTTDNNIKITEDVMTTIILMLVFLGGAEEMEDNLQTWIKLLLYCLPEEDLEELLMIVMMSGTMVLLHLPLAALV